jgi:hypothetical protein
VVAGVTADSGGRAEGNATAVPKVKSSKSAAPGPWSRPLPQHVLVLAQENLGRAYSQALRDFHANEMAVAVFVR